MQSLSMIVSRFFESKSIKFNRCLYHTVVAIAEERKHVARLRKHKHKLLLARMLIIIRGEFLRFTKRGRVGNFIVCAYVFIWFLIVSFFTKMGGWGGGGGIIKTHGKLI